MAQPNQTNVHIDGPLTNISVAYRNSNYIGESVFPRVAVQKRSDKYFIYTKGDWFRDEAQRRAPGTRAQRGGYSLSTDSYLCEQWAFATPVDDETVQNADNPLQPMADAANFVADKLLLKKEIQVADVAFGTTWSSSATPSPLWDVDTSDPIGDVVLANNTVEEASTMPNVGVIGGALWRHIKKHPDMIDRIKGAAGPGQPAILTQQAIAALFELERLLIGRGMKETGAEGGSSTRARIWGLHMLVLYVTGTASLRSPNAGYVFQLGSRTTYRWREDQEGQDIIESREDFDVKLTATDAGYLIKSAATT